ncbi:uncharacterized protein RSE6_06383 [Rhynchosporium secalis]|uniref:Uncharacterized protein n=1 Tax=Rhynchosporium secalis TaxID=38038 RepID=A0A1E1MAB1_RHYSE|nr:uncharacterized protein RSE6_06383 [Rhynchosporium secalis]
MFSGGRKVYAERNSRGHDRFVIGRPSSRPHDRESSFAIQELLDEAESRIQSLMTEVSSLQNSLSVAQRDQWHLQNLRAEHQRVVNEHYHCRNLGAQLDAQAREVRRFEDLFVEEEQRNVRLEDKNEELKEKIRLLKRGSATREEYQRRYEEKSAEVELLRRGILERDELLRQAETRVAQRDSRIAYLKNYLRDRGFWVD